MNNKGFAGLIGLLISVGIIFLIAYFAFQIYFGSTATSVPADEPTTSAVADAGINTSSQKSVLDSTKSKIKELEADRLKRAEELNKKFYEY